MSTTEDSRSTVSQQYSGRELPLASYFALLSAYGVAVGGALTFMKVKGIKLPKGIPAKDLMLLAVATHKLTRLIALDEVTSPIRAPFTKYLNPSGEGEVSEEPRGEGLQKAVGQLVGCPYCLSVWVATALGLTYAAAPSTARFVANIFAMVTGSDFLQRMYYATKKLDAI